MDVEQDKNIKKYKKKIEDLEASLKDIMSQNSGLRNNIDALKLEKKIDLLKKKKKLSKPTSSSSIRLSNKIMTKLVRNLKKSNKKMKNSSRRLLSISR